MLTEREKVYTNYFMIIDNYVDDKDGLYQQWYRTGELWKEWTFVDGLYRQWSNIIK